jgi:hypothetical protein
MSHICPTLITYDDFAEGGDDSAEEHIDDTSIVFDSAEEAKEPCVQDINGGRFYLINKIEKTKPAPDATGGKLFFISFKDWTVKGVVTCFSK